MTYLLVWLFAGAALAAGPSLVFEATPGPAGTGVRFVARSPQVAYGFTHTGLSASVAGSLLHWTFPGSRDGHGWQAESPSPLQVTSFVGPAHRWRRHTNTFSRLRWKGLYRGIDLLAYAAARPELPAGPESAGQQLELDFIVHPGADPHRIRMRFAGHRQLQLDPDGALVAETPNGAIRQRRPVSYQLDAEGRRQPVPSRFRLVNSREAAFEVGAYDPRRELVIDPVFVGLTYLGGEGDDDVIGFAGDFVCGSSASADFLLGIAAPFNTPREKSRDLFVYSGSQMFYFGGSGDDRPTACASFGIGGVVVAGVTTSRDFPAGLSRGGGELLARAGLRTQFRGAGGDDGRVDGREDGTDGFLLYLPLFSSNGTWIATFWGDPGQRVTALATGPADPTAIAIATQTAVAGRGTGSRIALLNASLDEQAFTVLDGSSDDRVDALRFGSRDLIVAGSTNSPDLLPELATVPTQGRDAFLLHLAIPSLQPLERRLFGGSGNEDVRALAVGRGLIWLGGSTTSPDLPLHQPWQSTLAGRTDGFASAFYEESLELRRSSYHGGSGDDSITAVLLGANDVLLAGNTSSVDLPVARGADQPRFAGGLTDGFYALTPLAGLSLGQPLSVASYLGGPGDDTIVGLVPSGGVDQFDVVGNTTAALDGNLIPPRSYRAGREGFRVTLKTQPVSEIVLGRGLHVELNEQFLSRAGALYRSSDPGKLLLSTQPFSELEPLISQEFGGIYLHGRADTGQADLIITIPGRPEQRVPVRLVPSGFAFRPFTQRLTLGSNGTFVPVVAALDPDSGQVLAEQQLSLRTGDPVAPTVESSHPAIVEIRGNNEFRALALGSATLRLRQPTGFRDTPPVQVTVANARFQFTCPALGQNLRTSAVVSIDGISSASTRLTVDEGGPVRLAINATFPDTYTALQADGGRGGTFWFDTSAASGSTTIRITGDGVEPASFVCPVYPSAFVFSGPSSTSLPREATVGQEIQTTIVAQVSEGLLSTGSQSAPQHLRPNGAPVPIRIEATGAAIDVPPSTFAPGSAQLNLRLTPRAVGRARLTIVSPPSTIAAARTLEVEARARAPFRAQAVVVGQHLSAPLVLFPEQNPTSTRLTLRGPRGAYLLRAEGEATGRAELSLVLRNAVGTVTIDAAGDVGPAPLVIDWEDGSGRGEITVPVEVVPARLGWANSSIADLTTTPWRAPLPLAVTGFIDVAGRGFLPQPLSPAAEESARFRLSPPSLAEIMRFENRVDGRVISQLSVQALAVGLADLTIEGILPSLPGRDKLRLRIIPAKLVLEPVVVGANLLETAVLTAESRLSSRSPNPLRIRLASSAPAVLRLSESPAALGRDFIEVTSTKDGPINYFVHGISAGEATITAESMGLEPVALPVVVLPSAIRLTNPPVITAETSTSEIVLTAQLTPLDSVRLTPLRAAFEPLRQPLRPGVETLNVDVTVEPAGIVQASSNRISFAPGSISATLRMRPLAAGRAKVTLTPPAGFVASADGAGTVTIELTGFRMIWNSPPSLGRDTTSFIGLRTSDGRPLPSPLTITSSDPSRVLLSARSIDPGRPQLSLNPSSSGVEVHLHGLAGDGLVTLTAQSPGVAGGAPVTQLVTLLPTSIAFDSSPTSLNLGQTTNLAVRPLVASFRTLQVRPGVNIPVTLRTVPPGILEVPAEVRLGEPFEVKALAVGSARIEAVVPPGFVSQPVTTNLIAVTLGVFNSETNLRLGKDLLTAYAVFATGNLPPDVRVTSSNPALLLVSASATAAGQSSAIITGNGSSQVYLHGLAARGVADLSITAPGFATKTVQVELVPSGFLLTSSLGRREVSVGTTELIRVMPAALDPNTLEPLRNSMFLRPGVLAGPLLSSSDPGVVGVSRRDPVTFEVSALSQGRARLSLTQPSGFAVPAPPQVIDFEVTDAFFTFDPPRVAQNLRVAATVRLAPPPADDARINVQIVSRTPDLLVVSGSLTSPGSGQATVIAQRGEASFFLDGLAGTGSTRLAVSAPGYRPFEIEFTLQPAGFVFSETSATLAPFSSWSTSVRPVPISSLTGQPFLEGRDYRLRPGLEDLTLKFDVTGSTGLRLSDIKLDASATWQPTATWTNPGTATVTIVPPPGFSASARNGSIIVSVQ